jgi:putative FmdB family regulatory protein
MPLYEYHCKECGEEFEKMVRFSEASQSPECPNCGSKQTHKQISTVATHLASASAGSCSTNNSRFS